jgi:hypothetical protein
MINCVQGDSPLLPITLTDAGKIVDLTTATAITVVGAIDGTPIFRRPVAGSQFGRITTCS